VSVNIANGYSLDRTFAEWYDENETYTDDIELIRGLIGGHGRLRILEPFCGTGRILIPLAQDGHEIIGIDQSRAMLDRAQMKIDALAKEIQRAITLVEGDVIAQAWPRDFDLVVLGGNCFYELATPEEQELCISSASAALKPGGYLYLDNNHMEGELDEAWRKPNETIWYDAPNRLWRQRRCSVITSSDGTTTKHEYVMQKHPVSVLEEQEWLVRHGFLILHLYGDRAGSTYTPEAGRGIFWARKEA
jgi:SAM-dependent methyltransferase